VRFAYFLIAAVAMADTLPIADENLRMTALHAIFPGMGISLVPGKRIGNAPQKKRGPYELDATDALAKENVYRMIGKATNEAERCASEDLRVSGKFSDTRLLRFKLYHWPNSPALLVVLQYNFDAASPAGACWSTGLLERLDETKGEWSVRDRYLLDPRHHTTLLSVRLLDLNGDAGTNRWSRPTLAERRRMERLFWSSI
jgi:hypothetical protein